MNCNSQQHSSFLTKLVPEKEKCITVTVTCDINPNPIPIKIKIKINIIQTSHESSLTKNIKKSRGRPLGPKPKFNSKIPFMNRICSLCVPVIISILIQKHSSLA